MTAKSWDQRDSTALPSTTTALFKAITKRIFLHGLTVHWTKVVIACLDLGLGNICEAWLVDFTSLPTKLPTQRAKYHFSRTQLQHKRFQSNDEERNNSERDWWRSQARLVCCFIVWAGQRSDTDYTVTTRTRELQQWCPDIMMHVDKRGRKCMMAEEGDRAFAERTQADVQTII